MPSKQSFGSVLAELRENNGLSQQAIGDLIGVSRSAVNGYEKGKSYPVADKLLKLAQHFGVSVDYLLTGKNHVRHIIPDVEIKDAAKSPSDSSVYYAPAHDKQGAISAQFIKTTDTQRDKRLQIMIREDRDGEEIFRWAGIDEVIEVLSNHNPTVAKKDSPRN